MEPKFSQNGAQGQSRYDDSGHGKDGRQEDGAVFPVWPCLWQPQVRDATQKSGGEALCNRSSSRARL